LQNDVVVAPLLIDAGLAPLPQLLIAGMDDLAQERYLLT
jgi:hypothetical protein